MPTQKTPNAPNFMECAHMNLPRTKGLAEYHLPPEQKINVPAQLQNQRTCLD
jgi:hypothetical protein